MATAMPAIPKPRKPTSAMQPKRIGLRGRRGPPADEAGTELVGGWSAGSWVIGVPFEVGYSAQRRYTGTSVQVGGRPVKPHWYQRDSSQMRTQMSPSGFW